ncbi:hypothetical protein Tco_1257102 [Tanacetum coccineum]
MFFYLITLNLARFLNETAPQVEPPKEGKLSNAQAVKAWKHSAFLCHNYVLDGLGDRYSSYVYGRCFEAFRNLMCHNYALYGLNGIKTEAMRESDLRSSRIDDEVVQDKRQRDDNDLQDERQDEPKEEEVEPRRCKKGKNREIVWT